MPECFELPPELNIYTAGETRDALLAWAAEQSTRRAGQVLEISAAAVAETDGAGLQLLAALGNNGQAWRLVQASARFAESCQVLGLGQWLESARVAGQQETAS